jgi:hypothetical protein
MLPMSVVISGEPRARLRDMMRDHRARSIMTDADYCIDVLRVSLNTFKKCVGEESELTLKRHTLNGLLARLGATLPDLERHQRPAPMVDYGGYTRESHGYLEGRYLHFRRDFGDPQTINRAVLDIAWDQAAGSLRWSELRRFRSPATGDIVANDFHGHVYMHQERILMGLPCFQNGCVRLTTLHVPARHALSSKLSASDSLGAVLTHGYPKRFFQPVVSPIAIKAIDQKKWHVAPETLCKHLKSGTPDYDLAHEHLRMAEEQSCEMTPLTWRDMKTPV